MSLRCTMILGDCLRVVPSLGRIVDFVFADIPYGVLSAAWDKRLDLARLWQALSSVRKEQAPVCLMGTCPYVADIINSNRTNFSYDIVWIKSRGTGAFQAKRRPMRAHETILLFYGRNGTYLPQMRPASRERRGQIHKPSYSSSAFGPISAGAYTYSDKVFPLSWIKVEPEHARHKTHSSQKPPGLMDWLVLSFSRPGQTVLDPVAGSASTALSALNSSRNVICIEKDRGYYEAAVERVRKSVTDGGIDAKVEVRQ